MKGLLMLAAILIILPGCGTLQSAKAPVHEQVKGKQVTVQTKSNPDSQSTQGGPSLGSKEKKSQDKQTETKGNEGKASIEKPKFVEPKPEYKVMKNNYIKPIGGADPKVVLLTIDDAPDDHAVEMAQTLKNLHAKAIFYIMGVFIDSEEGKAKLKKIQQLGFPVGDHTKTHPHLPDLSKADQETEIMSVYNNIEDTLGKPPKFFRAPFGQNTDVSFA
ncbi:MAG TPA: polysaccharide deacetylase family protein, partial [Bacillales bacterium]|nr:polysaccharide deacetylase family protein [Bacillales bacterium]